MSRLLHAATVVSIAPRFYDVFSSAVTVSEPQPLKASTGEAPGRVLALAAARTLAQASGIPADRLLRAARIQRRPAGDWPRSRNRCHPTTYVLESPLLVDLLVRRPNFEHRWQMGAFAPAQTCR